MTMLLLAMVLLTSTVRAADRVAIGGGGAGGDDVCEAPPTTTTTLPRPGPDTIKLEELDALKLERAVLLARLLQAQMRDAIAPLQAELNKVNEEWGALLDKIVGPKAKRQDYEADLPGRVLRKKK